MNRRGLLMATAVSVTMPGAVMAGQAGQTAHPDADLLALAERFIAHERAIQAMPCDAETEAEEKRQHAEQRRMIGIQHTLTLQLGALRATTADGVAARARCLAVHNADGAFSMEDPNTTTGRLLRCLMRDAGTLNGSVAEPVTSPDADLLKACAAFDVLERAYIAAPGDFWPGTPEERAVEAERDRISAAQDPLVERICELRAVTREGQAARARSLALWDAELMKPGPGDTGTWLTAAIVRDLISEAGA